MVAVCDEPLQAACYVLRVALMLRDMDRASPSSQAASDNGTVAHDEDDDYAANIGPPPLSPDMACAVDTTTDGNIDRRTGTVLELSARAGRGEQWLRLRRVAGGRSAVVVKNKRGARCGCGCAEGCGIVGAGGQTTKWYMYGARAVAAGVAHAYTRGRQHRAHTPGHAHEDGDEDGHAHAHDGGLEDRHEDAGNVARQRQSAAAGARTGKRTRSVHANEDGLEDWHNDGRLTASNRGGNGGQAAATGGDAMSGWQ